MTLRDYQQEGADRVWELFGSGTRSICASMPTGGGKTIFACEGIIRREIEQGGVAWFNAPWRSLIGQTSRKLEQLGIHDFGIIHAGNKRKRPFASIQVCSKDTLIAAKGRRLDEVKREPTLLVFDEGHHVTDDNSYSKIINRFPKARVLLLTATPARTDGKGLGRVADEMVEIATMSMLLERGWLIPTFAFGGSTGDLSGVQKNNGDYVRKQLGQRMDKAPLLGDIVKEWIRRGDERPTICFATTVDHSKHIADMFAGAGIPSIHIDANSSEEERERMRVGLTSGKIKVASSVGVFLEGFDCPEVGTIIDACPTASLPRFIQKIGRGLRPSKGKATPGEYCIVLDHAGNTWRHGFADIDREWSLADGVINKAEDNTPLLRACPSCYVIVPKSTKICPNCQYVLKNQSGDQQFLPSMDETVELREIRREEIIRPTIEEAKEKDRKAYFRWLATDSYKKSRKAQYVLVRFSKRFGESPRPEDMEASRVRIGYKRHLGKGGAWDYYRVSDSEVIPLEPSSKRSRGPETPDMFAEAG